MHTTHEFEYRPTCQAATAADCSNCTASYDCVRARSGRTMSWGFVVLAMLLAVGLVATTIV